VSGHQGYTYCATCSIVLYVYGVYNPQKIANTTIGQFSLGFIKSRTFSQYIRSAGTVTLQSAPGYNNIIETLTDSTSSRLET
jgi:hypothetical protein